MASRVTCSIVVSFMLFGLSFIKAPRPPSVPLNGIVNISCRIRTKRGILHKKIFNFLNGIVNISYRIWIKR